MTPEDRLAAEPWCIHCPEPATRHVDRDGRPEPVCDQHGWSAGQYSRATGERPNPGTTPCREHRTVGCPCERGIAAND